MAKWVDLDELYRRELSPLHKKSAEITKLYWELRIKALPKQP